MEILKSLLKWIILAIIFILLIVLIVKFANKSSNKKTTKENNIEIVEKSKDEQPVEERENTELTQENELVAENQVVDSPDTASSALPAVLLGLGIISVGGYYIYRNREEKENA